MQVLLADDHAMVRDGLKPLVRRIADDVTVVEAASLAESLEVAESADDLRLAILDLKMPGMNGLVGLENFREKYPDVPAVILSGSLERQDIMDSVNRGAAGYIPKTAGGEALINALRLVLAGERYFPSFVFAEGPPDAAAAAEPEGPLGQLSEKEGAVLELVIEGLSNKEIARQLGVREITVKKRLSGVFRKLGVTNRTQATRLAIQHGWPRATTGRR